MASFCLKDNVQDLKYEGLVQMPRLDPELFPNIFARKTNVQASLLCA